MGTRAKGMEPMDPALLPEDLSTASFRDLQRAAKALGVSSFGVKRPELEAAIAARRPAPAPRDELPEEPEPLPDEVLDAAQGPAQSWEEPSITPPPIGEEPEPSPVSRAAEVAELPDLTKGERPPGEGIQPTLEPAEAEQAAPTEPKPPEPEDGKYKPVLFYSLASKLKLQVEGGVAGWRDRDGIIHEGKRGVIIEFQPRSDGGRGGQRWAITKKEEDFIRNSVKFQRGQITVASDAIEREIKLKQLELEVLKMRQGGASPAAIAELLKKRGAGPMVVQGGRHTRMHESQTQGFGGLEALLRSPLGGAVRSAFEAAERYGELAQRGATAPLAR